MLYAALHQRRIAFNLVSDAHKQVRKLTVLPKHPYEEDREVTPTMKIKRKFVSEAFKDIIEAMY